MKTTNRTNFLTRTGLMLLMAAFVMTGCKKKKDVVQAAPDGEVLITEYCAGPEYFSNNEVFRSSGLGESMDQQTARRKAMNDARGALASAISTTIKATTDNYVNSREFNNKEEVQERFESLTREVVNQELNGVKTICQKAVRVTSNNNFKYYVAIELSGQDILGAMNQRLSKDERLRIDYDYEQFKKTFEQEMNNFSNSRN